MSIYILLVLFGLATIIVQINKLSKWNFYRSAWTWTISGLLPQSCFFSSTPSWRWIHTFSLSRLSPQYLPVIDQSKHRRHKNKTNYRTPPLPNELILCYFTFSIKICQKYDHSLEKFCSLASFGIFDISFYLFSIRIPRLSSISSIIVFLLSLFLHFISFGKNRFE